MEPSVALLPQQQLQQQQQGLLLQQTEQQALEQQQMLPFRGGPKTPDSEAAVSPTLQSRDLHFLLDTEDKTHTYFRCIDT